MSQLAKCFNCLREAFRKFRKREVEIVKLEGEPTIIAPRPMGACDSGTVYLSLGGVRVPEQYINEYSNVFEVIPTSGQNLDRGLCILLPWKWVGWVESAEIKTKRRTYELHNTTRDYAIETLRPYPNGARVFLRTKNREDGDKIGRGVLRVIAKDGSCWTYEGDFERGHDGWKLERQ